jgi:hypothetical protein
VVTAAAVGCPVVVVVDVVVDWRSVGTVPRIMGGASKDADADADADADDDDAGAGAGVFSSSVISMVNVNDIQVDHAHRH